MIATKSGLRVRKPREKVPEYLIYEIMDGQPIHYNGYREVLAGNKKLSDIMGSSTLQSFIVAYVLRVLMKGLSEDDYVILTSEAGLHLDRRNNLAGDILIFDSKTLPIEKIDEHYADVPPKVAIEVDIMADPADMQPDTYLFRKTQKLLDFGVEKVIWITTYTKKVTVATPQAPWQVLDWNDDIEIMGGVVCNVGAYLTRKGSSLA
jgi:hypothetical protein